MKRTEILREVRKMRFEEAYEGWKKGRWTQEEAARLLGICDRTYRRYLTRCEALTIDILPMLSRLNFSKRSKYSNSLLPLTTLT